MTIVRFGFAEKYNAARTWSCPQFFFLFSVIDAESTGRPHKGFSVLFSSSGVIVHYAIFYRLPVCDSNRHEELVQRCRNDVSAS